MADETTPAPDEEQPELIVPAVGSKKKTPDGDLCGSCWPEGWPKSGDAAECAHGTWTR